MVSDSNLMSEIARAGQSNDIDVIKRQLCKLAQAFKEKMKPETFM